MEEIGCSDKLSEIGLGAAGLGEIAMLVAPECKTRRISGCAHGGRHGMRVKFGGADNGGNLHWISVLVRSSFWEIY